MLQKVNSYVSVSTHYFIPCFDWICQTDNYVKLLNELNKQLNSDSIDYQAEVNAMELAKRNIELAHQRSVMKLIESKLAMMSSLLESKLIMMLQTEKSNEPTYRDVTI